MKAFDFLKTLEYSEKIYHKNKSKTLIVQTNDSEVNFLKSFFGEDFVLSIKEKSGFFILDIDFHLPKLKIKSIKLFDGFKFDISFVNICINCDKENSLIIEDAEDNYDVQGFGLLAQIRRYQYKITCVHCKKEYYE